MNRLTRTTAFALGLAACGAALAQQPGPAPAPSGAGLSSSVTPADEAPGQRIERIHVEDRGSSVDEVRKGGETQSITVRPKTGSGRVIPPYEVKPATGPGDMNRRQGGPGQTGDRAWKVLEF